MMPIKFKISKKEGCYINDVNSIVEDGLFAFTHTRHNGNRPHVITKKKRDSRYNCFEISNYSDGVIISGMSVYDEFYNDIIKEKVTKNIDLFVYNQLMKSGCGESTILYYEAGPFKKFIKQLFEKLNK